MATKNVSASEKSTKPVAPNRTQATGKSKAATISSDLPSVSKQTAGGIVGATLGGMVGGPVGAFVGGVAGAMVGNASAEGQHPIETAVESIRGVAEKPIRKTVKRVAKAITTKAAEAKAAVTKAMKTSKKPATKLAVPKKGKVSHRTSTKAASTRH